MKKALIVLLIALPFLGFSQKKGQILWGKNYMYGVTTPKGWVCDTTSKTIDGYDAAFYPNGSTYNLAPIKLFTQFVSVAGNKTIDSYIEQNIKEFETYTTGKVKYSHEQVVKNTGSFKIYSYEYKSNDQAVYGYLAYTQAVGGFMVITLTTQDQKLFTDDIKVLNNFAASYYWLTDKIEIQTED